MSQPHPVERDWGFAQITVEQLSIVEVITDLMLILGPALTAAVSGTKDRSCPDRWLVGQQVPVDAQLRLKMALTCVRFIAFDEGDDQARRLMVGTNQLTGNALALDIRTGDFDSVKQHLVHFALGTAD